MGLSILKNYYHLLNFNVIKKILYEPIAWGENKIEFIVKGEKMEGRYVLVKFKKAGEKNWLLFKESD
jgi:hypothetical protein